MLQARSPDDAARYYLSLVDAGLLEKKRLQVAAALGHTGAQACGIESITLPDHYRSKIQVAASHLSYREAIAFALECATRVLAAFVHVRPHDDRVANCLEATRRWLNGEVVESMLEPASRDASDAARELDDPNLATPDVEFVAAIHAADAATHAALAAAHAAKIESKRDEDTDAAYECVAWTARFGLHAAAQGQLEEEWQLGKLASYLLKERSPAIR